MKRKLTGDAYYRRREEIEATRPQDEPYGTCDWGGCDEVATTWRHDDEHGWLPVCPKCLRTTWDTTGPGGLPRRKAARPASDGAP